MTNKELFDLFKPLAEFIAKILGPSSEVVLHDLSDFDHSIVKIQNGYITSRTIGDGITDFSLRFLRDNNTDNRSYIDNYLSLTKGNKKLRSSTFFIKNKKKIIGLLCVNTNDEVILDLIAKAQSLLVQTQNPNSEEISNIEMIQENFTVSIDELSTNVISEYISSKGVDVDYLKQEDKIEIVKILNKQGYFLLKGSITKLSTLLKISEASIYRYLQHIKNNS